jgi:hypothetical protein
LNQLVFNTVQRAPELKNNAPASMLFVFSL